MFFASSLTCMLIAVLVYVFRPTPFHCGVAFDLGSRFEDVLFLLLTRCSCTTFIRSCPIFGRVLIFTLGLVPFLFVASHFISWLLRLDYRLSSAQLCCDIGSSLYTYTTAQRERENENKK